MSEHRPPVGLHWVVDMATRSLHLNLVRESELDMTSAWSSALTTAVDGDVNTILATFDLKGQFAVKSHVDFAVRLNQLHRALKAVGSPTVWNLHASSGNPRNDDVWNARGLIVCYNEVLFQLFHKKYRVVQKKMDKV